MWSEVKVAHSCPTLCDPKSSILNISSYPTLDYVHLGQWHSTPVLLPGKSHGWRSLVGVHGVAKSRTRLSDFTFTFSLSCIGEGNGNPLQCSCLENPRDGGAWWADVYGITHSRSRLKWLSRTNLRLNWSLHSFWVPISLFLLFSLPLSPSSLGIFKYFEASLILQSHERKPLLGSVVAFV